jgi:plasmid maintenance system antidote protein VapI
MAQKIKPKPTLAEDLKAAIAASGMNDNQLAKAAGISPIAIGRFVRGERGLTLESAGKIAAVLGLRLTKSEA